jgi:hypothetical protein
MMSPGSSQLAASCSPVVSPLQRHPPHPSFRAAELPSGRAFESWLLLRHDPLLVCVTSLVSSCSCIRVLDPRKWAEWMEHCMPFSRRRRAAHLGCDLDISTASCLLLFHLAMDTMCSFDLLALSTLLVSMP